MARIRYLKPDFFKDEDLAALSFETRLFFAGLWGIADKSGRLEDRPLRLKAEIFPYDNVDVKKCLEDLNKPKNGSGKPFVHRYETDGQRYIQIVNWEKHQRPHHTEQESKIPPCIPLMEKGMGMEMGMEMEKQLEASTELRNGETTVVQPLKEAPSGKPLRAEISFSMEKTSFENILPEEISQWKNAYPACDVPAEIQRAALWLKANPAKRKKNNFRFLTNWLARAQERGGDIKSNPVGKPKQDIMAMAREIQMEAQK